MSSREQLRRENAARVLEQAQSRGWMIRAGATEGVLVAERDGQDPATVYGSSAQDLARTLETRYGQRR